ncbi:FAD-binding protein [Nocardia vaccinii]|uniref:FAD-binding protein n=1 Tax=Nocardia vaccinii TaxID=1822 RepID=UPI0008303944|nr:FAD-binding protein [Nocardia vaccinii]
MTVSLRIAILVKQIPAVQEMRLDSNGRLRREGLTTELNAYCRRAVAKAVELVAEYGGECVVLTLGPPNAEEVLRESIAWAHMHDVRMTGVHACDPRFAGSDTLATANALAAVLRREGPFDLVLIGRASLDADTGQVGPQIAELLRLPFATAVREFSYAPDTSTISVRCEHDDGSVRATVTLPAVVSAAERLIAPCKVVPEGRAAVAGELIRTVTAAELGQGPWGQAGSPTRVGPTRVHSARRTKHILSGPIQDQVAEAITRLIARGALRSDNPPALTEAVPARQPGSASGAPIAVVLEPDRPRVARELLCAAAKIANQIGGHVVALGPGLPSAESLGAWGADKAIGFTGSTIEEDLARGIATWAQHDTPQIMLIPSTAWGREIAGRVAARLAAGLVGDSVDLELHDGRLVAWKPAFGGQLVAAVISTSDLQMATVRAGALPLAAPRRYTAELTHHALTSMGGIEIIDRYRDDDLDILEEALTVIGIGAGVSAQDHERLVPLQKILGAELAATRKVTDRGELPRARQIGITGRSIAPRLYIALGISGKFNHSVGVRRAQTVLAVNSDPSAPIFDSADIGVVGDWRAAVDALIPALEATGGL